MKKNIGISDRLIRFVFIDLLLGASLLGLEVPILYANLAFGLSLIIVITILTAYSPLYHLFGISTLEINKENNSDIDRDSFIAHQRELEVREGMKH